MENNKIFFWSVCFILLLPIIVLPPTFQPADWSRTILFRVGLTVLISFLAYRFFYKKEGLSFPKWNFFPYLPLLILLAFFAVLILSTAFSQDVKFSIFGSPNRAGGVLNLLFFLVFAVILALYSKKENWKKLFTFLLSIGAVASLFGIVQYFNIFKNIFISYESGNTPSFLGNSTFLAIYMLFLAFLSLTLLITEKIKKRKIIYGVLFLLFVFTIIITGARATYLGLLTGFFFFFFFYPVKLPEGQIQPFQKRAGLFNWVNPKKFKTVKIIAASLIIIATLAVLILNLYPQIGEKNKLLKIAVNRTSASRIAADLLGTRFAAWKITIEGIKDKPLLGWGPENFYIAFEKHYDPKIKEVKNMWWDRPHNIFLDIAVSSGVISLIIYCIFWILILWQLQIFKRRNGDEPDTYLAHGTQAMFLGYLAALFFNFDSFATYLISFFFIGFAFYLIFSKLEKADIVFFADTGKIPKRAIIAVLSVFIIAFLWFQNIKPLYINEKISYADNTILEKKCEKAMVIADEIWKGAGILNSYTGLRYADFVKRCVSLQPEKETNYVSKGYEALKSSSEAQPKFTRAWLFLGGFTNALAAKEENPEKQKKMLAEAISYLKKGLELSPKRQKIIIEMEKSYLISKDYEAMKKLAEDCIKIDSSYGQCYWYLGVAEIFLGDQENGKKHAEEAEEKTSAGLPYIQLGVAYISQKNYKDAAEAYRLAVIGNPDNASYHAVYAFLLKEIGEYGKAAKEAIEVFKLQPENKEVPEFLRQLLGLSPGDPAIHSSLAFVYKEMGDLEKAIQEYLILKSLYLQVIAKKPQDPGYHFSLAKVLKELQDYDGAYNEAVLAEKLNPDYHADASYFISTLPEKYWKEYTGKK